MKEFKKAVYELTFILAPTLSEEEKKELIEQILSLIEREGGEIMKVEKWGERDLAYPIKRFEKGYYVYVLHQADRGLSRKVERQLKLKEGVLRYLTVRIKRKVLLTRIFSGERGKEQLDQAGQDEVAEVKTREKEYEHQGKEEKR